ncbi:hypothetical protein QBC43DRAFT_351439 [Cladorrhinum sp. PSN259]|nr:hypothetical protein QBC43DRAFT_351439 [Cladorrhinum sp. PSN259]
MGLLFGVSFAVSIPLAIIAFRVNTISAKLLLWLPWLSVRKSKNTNDQDDDDDDDHDDCDGDDKQHDGSDSESRSSAADATFIEPMKNKRESTFEEMDGRFPSDRRHWRYSQYAPIFNRWHFHKKIPFFRLLWRYRVNANDNRWDEKVERDYPLHRAVLLVRRLRRRFIVDPLLKLVPSDVETTVKKYRAKKDMVRQERIERRESDRKQDKERERRRLAMKDPEMGLRSRGRART